MMETKIYEPIFRSFVRGLPIDLSPAFVAGTILLFNHPNAKWILWLLFWLMLGISILMLLLNVHVHFLQKLFLNESGIGSVVCGSKVFVPWHDVRHALLRERENPISSEDRLLVIEGREAKFAFPISTFTQQDQAELLKILHEHVHLEFKRDRFSI